MSYYGNQNPTLGAQPVPGVAERELWQTVVYHALIDATHEVTPNTTSAVAADKREALAWITGGGQDFRDVLTWAGMDHTFVRESFLAGRVNGDLLRGITSPEARRHRREADILKYLSEPRTAGDVAQEFGMPGTGTARDVIRLLARDGMIKEAGQVDYVQMWQRTGATAPAKPRPERKAATVRTQGRRIQWTEPMERMIVDMRNRGATFSEIANQLALKFKVAAPTPNAIKVKLTNIRKRDAS